MIGAWQTSVLTNVIELTSMQAVRSTAGSGQRRDVSGQGESQVEIASPSDLSDDSPHVITTGHMSVTWIPTQR